MIAHNDEKIGIMKLSPFLNIFSLNLKNISFHIYYLTNHFIYLFQIVKLKIGFSKIMVLINTTKINLSKIRIMYGLSYPKYS